MPETVSPRLVDWAITEVCNLDCKHCRGIPKGELSTERARALIAEIARLEPGWVIVEGGEPLLRRDIFELLGLMRRNNLEVHLISNGMLLDSEITARLKDLGVKLMISIDGATPATYESIRGGARFDRVVQSARNSAREGILEAINMTLLRRNFREIPGLFRLARDIGVRRITFIGLKPCRNYEAELLTADEYAEAIALVCGASRETGVGFFFDEPFFWPVVKATGLSAEAPEVGTGILVPEVSQCIFGEYLFVETSGQVRPCSFSSLSLGEVREKPLDRIWEEAVASPFLRKVGNPDSRTGYCQTCPYLAECKGCRARTFMLTGDWFASDPVCPLARKAADKTG